MASNIAPAAAADSPVSRKRPAEDEAPKAEELQPAGESAVAAPAADTTDASAENGADDEGEQQPAKRARKEEEDGDDEKKEEEEEKNKKEQKAEESGGGGKLAFLGPTGSGEGFSSFSSLAAGPLSFSSVSSGAADAGAAPFNLGAAGSTPGPFSIDFSSPTPFGSLFGGEVGKDSAAAAAAAAAAATPSLTSTGFTLFSSSSPSTSSGDFAFSLSSSSSSLLFSSGAESSSASVAEKVEVVTGEENEERVHSVRAKLLKLEPETQAWKERGSGQLHLNVAKDRSYARLVMRAEGALRLILNTALFPHTITKRVQEKGVQVSAVEEGKPVLYLLRASRRDEAEELFAAINRHKELGGSSFASSV